MRPRRLLAIAALMFAAPAAAPLLAQSPAPAAAATNSAVTPADRLGEPGWKARYESLSANAKAGDVALVFLGDSITEGWEGSGREVWQRHFAGRKALNLGISGDRTQHVLWRLDHGNVDGLAAPAAPGKATPKLVVLMIGTNNSNGADNTAAEIADGITAVVKKLGQKLPEAKVLMLAIFPRGEKPNPQREKNAEASRLAARIADGKRVHTLDIGAKFLAPDGSLSTEIMPDFLHLSPKGYAIWADAIEPTVKDLLGEKN